MYKSLQTGRAIAAIFVVLFHLGGAIAAEKYFGNESFAIPFLFGGAGVEFFFVLSGFIILTAHWNDIGKPNNLASYLKKRIIRIYPTYWIVFISVFSMAAVSTAWRDTVPHDAFILLKSLLLIPQDTTIAGGTGAPIIIVAWTLQYEIFFYLCFALMIINRLLSTIVGLVIFYLYTKYSGISPLPFPLSFLASDYILLFIMGMSVSAACASGKIRLDKPAVYASVGALMFSLIALDTVLQTNLIKAHRTILYGLASSLIVFGLVQLEDNGLIIGKNRLIQILGDSSYALYLIHYPLISVLCKLSLMIQLNKLGAIGAAIAYIFIFSACLITAVAFHLWLEKPITAYFRHKAGDKGRQSSSSKQGVLSTQSGQG